ncbi:unnamed protein product [Nezara viridula]|uniref:Uncharacterized protein n=1 Tax=Nezara viridula TaxID=85310 RepID=A0A9P0MVP4_NEZVI|nr:unnamed protein product [Nezara viridula]
MLKSPGHANRLKVKTGHARSQKLTFQLDYTRGLHATTDGRLRKGIDTGYVGQHPSQTEQLAVFLPFAVEGAPLEI